MHDVAIWSGARTADEITQDMANPPGGSEPGLLAYYPLDPTHGLTAVDQSTNHRDGGLGEARRGANQLQNYPLLVTSADGRRRGWLGASLPDAAYRVEFFASAGIEVGGSGQAETYLGSLDVTTDDTGQAIFDVPFTPPADKPFITATATDPDGNTSEISALRAGILESPPGEVRMPPAGPLVFSSTSGDAIALQDPEEGPLDAAWELTLSVPSGTLTLSRTSGLVGSGNGTATLDYSGGLSSLNAALEGLKYTAPAGFSGNLVLTVTARSDGAIPLSAEVRITNGIFVVKSIDESGPGSLRQAILDANDTPGQSTIAFAIPGAGMHVIAPASPLPAITSSVLIDGFSQPGYAGVPLIELNGHGAGNADGLTLAGSGATIRGLSIGGYGFGAAIVVTGASASGDSIYSNMIGIAPTDNSALPNGTGILIAGGAHDNTIGGTDPALGNVIAFNSGSGVAIQGDDSVRNRLNANRIFSNGDENALGGLKFDGSGSVVDLPASLIHGLGPAQTIEAWFETTSGGVIIGSSDPGGWIPHLYVGTDGKLYGVSYSLFNPRWITSAETVTDGRWHHAALTSDSSQTLRLYLDGKLVGSVSNAPWDTWLTSTQIGAGNTAYNPWDNYSYPQTNGGWFGFKGQIDEVQIWSTARSDDQIQHDMSDVLAGDEAGLAAYYRFDEGSGTTAHDKTANHHDATLSTIGSSLSWAGSSGLAIDLGNDGPTANAYGTWAGTWGRWTSVR